MRRALAVGLTLAVVTPLHAAVLEIRTDRAVVMELDGREIYNPNQGRNLDVPVEPGTYTLRLLGWRRNTLEERELEVPAGHAVRIDWRRNTLSTTVAALPEAPEEARGVRAARRVMGAAATAAAVHDAGVAARDGVTDVQDAAARGESGHTRTEINIGSDGVTSDTQTAVARRDGSVEASRRTSSATTGPDGVRYERRQADARAEVGPGGVAVSGERSERVVAAEVPRAGTQTASRVQATSAGASAQVDAAADSEARAAATGRSEPVAERTAEPAAPPAPPARPVRVQLRRQDGPPVVVVFDDGEPQSVTSVRVVELVPGTYRVSVRNAHAGTERFAGTLVVSAGGGIFAIGPSGATAEGNVRWED